MTFYYRNLNKNFYKLSKSDFIIYFFLITTWILLCFSINTHPYEIHEMFNNPIKFLNGLRFILPVLAVSMSFLFSIYIIYFKKKKKLSLLLILFFLYFISQIFGLFNTSERDFNLDNSYLVLFGIGTLSIIFILDNYRSNKIAYSFIISFLIILFIVYFTILINSRDTLIHAILEGNFYAILNPYDKFIEQSLPRITGLTRSFAIFTLFFLTLFLIKKNNIGINYLIFIIIISLFFVVWMGQSRGSLLCYTIASIFFVFFLNDLNFYKKIIILISIPIISITLGFFIKSNSLILTQFAKDNLKIEKNILIAIDKKILEIKEEKELNEKTLSESFKHKMNDYRVINNKTKDSGRLVLWKKIINSYEKNKIFGYGPQGDRYILKDTKESSYFSTNSSNLLIYGFVSGGYIGLTLLIVINIYILILLTKYTIMNNLFTLNYKLNKEKFMNTLSVVLIIFFLVRSLFENSYGLFSIDFMIMIICLYLIELEIKKANNIG